MSHRPWRSNFRLLLSLSEWAASQQQPQPATRSAPRRAIPDDKLPAGSHKSTIKMSAQDDDVGQEGPRRQTVFSMS